jgi:hypothetical protein
MQWLNCAAESAAQMTDTCLQPEEYAYPHGGQTRKGRALFADGKVRRVYAGIPDTFFTIPAHTRIAGKYISGYVYSEDNVLRFQQSP